MPSKPKTPILPGRRYHIYNRGVRRQRIFHDKGDYVRFLTLLRKYVNGKPIVPLCYCLLPNHFHLYVEILPFEELPTFYQTKPKAIARIIGHLQSAYAKFYNGKYDMVGTGAVFQQHFDRVLIEGSRQRETITHYVNMNALHHGLVTHPLDYPYTSLQELMHDDVDSYVNREPIYQDFGGRDRFIERTHHAARKRFLIDDWEDEGP